jgi:hypothetical protein
MPRGIASEAQRRLSLMLADSAPLEGSHSSGESGSMRLLISIALILLATGRALAATITLAPQTPDRPNVITVEGPLVSVDGDQFAAKAASLRSAIVAFSSDGGSLVAGVRIGEAIRRKGFSTFVPDGRRCASACALAWLGGIERYIGADATIGFHAGYDMAGGTETGIGNAMVGAYLTKIGLPNEAVIYITQAASKEMTWLKMSDLAQQGIRVTLLSKSAKETLVAIPTRYGNITVTRDDSECCVGHIRYGNQQVEIVSAGRIYASLEGVYKVNEGDLVVISSPPGARGLSPRYHVLLVDQDRMIDLAGPDFETSGTFKATQRGDEVHFDLGFQENKKKSAIYKNGAVTVDLRSPGPRATLPKSECATILNMAVTCVRLPECNEAGISDNFAMAGQRYFNSLEQMPVFTIENFYTVCTTVCLTKSYVAKQARSVLCGY